MKKILNSILGVSLMALLLSGCASGPTTSGGGALSNPEVSIVFANSRESELEPCGCSLRPLGGVSREAEALEKWKKEGASNLLAVSSGITFVPADYKAKQKKTFVLKGAYVVDAMNALGVEVLSPSVADLALGLDNIRKFEAQSKFPWTSANLVMKKNQEPLFKPFVEIEKNGKKFVFVGISGVMKSSAAEVQVLAPKVALQKIFQGAKWEDRVVVLLTTLSRTARADLVKSFPQIRFVLGGTAGEIINGAEILSTTTVAVNPDNRGKEIARVDLWFKGSSLATVSGPDHLEAVFYAKDRLEERKRVLENEAKSADPKVKKKAEAGLAEANAKWEALNKITSLDGKEGIIFKAVNVGLDQNFEPKEKSALQTLVEKYKEATRQAALKK